MKTVYLVCVSGRPIGEIVETLQNTNKPDPLKAYPRTPYKVRPVAGRRHAAFPFFDEAKKWLIGKVKGDVTTEAFKPLPREALAILLGPSDDGDFNPGGMRLNQKEAKARDVLVRMGLVTYENRVTTAGQFAIRTGLASTGAKEEATK
jgi:hypothetical protein